MTGILFLKTRTLSFLVGLTALFHAGADGMDRLPEILRRLDEQSRRIAELEAQNRAMRATIAKLQATLPVVVSNTVSTAPASQALGASGSPSVPSGKIDRLIAPLTERGVRLNPYGYIKLDLIHNTSRTDGDDYSFYVRPPWENGGQSESTIGLRESRLGVDLVLPEEEGGLTLSGKFEIDFYAGTVASPNLRIRHAYLNFDADDGWSLLAGQTIDACWVAGPKTLDGAWGGGTGHPYARRPQLRLTKTRTFDDDTRLTARLAAVQNAGTDLDDNLEDDGASSCWPLIQSALILEKRLWTERASTFALSGSYGRERIDAAADPIANDVYDADLLMGTVVLPVCRKFTLAGALFVGENMDTYKAGILQGINLSRGVPISSRGGWVQATLEPQPAWHLNLGYACEDADDADLNWRDRTLNWRYYANGLYDLTPHVRVAAEYAHLLTKFCEDVSAADDRFHLALYYFF